MLKNRKLSPVKAGVVGVVVAAAGAVTAPATVSQVEPCEPGGHWQVKAARWGRQVPGPQGRPEQLCSQLATLRPLRAPLVSSSGRPFTTTWGQEFITKTMFG